MLDLKVKTPHWPKSKMLSSTFWKAPLIKKAKDIEFGLLTFQSCSFAKPIHITSQFITHQAGNWNLKSYTHIIHFQGMTCILLSNLISSDAFGFLIVLIRRSNFAAVNRVPNVIVI